MHHGFFFVAVFSPNSRLLRLYHCVSICIYAFTLCLIRQKDNTVYHYLFNIQQQPAARWCCEEMNQNQPCIKHYNHQVL